MKFSTLFLSFSLVQEWLFAEHWTMRMASMMWSHWTRIHESLYSSSPSSSSSPRWENIFRKLKRLLLLFRVGVDNCLGVNVHHFDHQPNDLIRSSAILLYGVEMRKKKNEKKPKLFFFCLRLQWLVRPNEIKNCKHIVKLLAFVVIVVWKTKSQETKTTKGRRREWEEKRKLKWTLSSDTTNTGIHQR